MPPRRRRASRGSGEQLREEIIAAAKQLLADSGRVEDVSIRSVADAVRVTSPSIYLHFADKDELISAVVADVFRELDDAMVAGAADETTPLGRLRAFGMSYIRFAVAHPEQYRLATMGLTSRSSTDVDEILADSAFTHFNQTVVECFAAGIFAGDDPLPITLELWTAAHGVASLLIAKPHVPWGDVDEFADRVLCAAALGHAAAAFVGDEPTTDKVTAWIHAQRKAQRRRANRLAPP